MLIIILQYFRCNLVFLNFLFQGFSIALPFNLIMVSDIFFKVNSIIPEWSKYVKIFSQYLLVDNEASSISSQWTSSLPNVLLTTFSIQLLIALPTSFFPVRSAACLSFISVISISTFHFQMVLSASRRLHSWPGHLHSDADSLHPDEHQRDVHPPHLHPPLHLHWALPDLLLRDVVEAPDQILRGSSSGHGETDWG